MQAKTKDLGGQIILMFVEIEQQEKVIEELIKGLAQKNPKVVAGCVTNLTNCLRAFGAKVIKVSPLLKAVVPLLDHRDKVVREEGKQLIIEAYRYAKLTNTFVLQCSCTKQSKLGGQFTNFYFALKTL